MNAISLAIGDGANDVSMIQAAHVGMSHDTHDMTWKVLELVEKKVFKLQELLIMQLHNLDS